MPRCLRSRPRGWMGTPVPAAAWLAIVGAFLLGSLGCQRVEPLAGTTDLDHVRAEFGVYWPPIDPDEPSSRAVPPLLNGTLSLDARDETPGKTLLRLAVTLTRPSTEDDRESWNSTLAFADIAWMGDVRVWDADRKWLWPNLPFLLRLPGRERVERYGGVDPGKHVDNDFAAVLIRKYDASGTVESSETKESPLVSAEWHAMDAGPTDLHSIVHVARSDEFLVHLGDGTGRARGRLKLWLIYADFLRARPPRTWPREGEWAGGILTFFEIDWETSPEHACRAVVRHHRPTESTRFDWFRWVVREPGSDVSEARFRLSDRPEPASP